MVSRCSSDTATHVQSEHRQLVTSCTLAWTRTQALNTLTLALLLVSWNNINIYM